MKALNKYDKIGYGVIALASLVTIIDMFLSTHPTYTFNLEWEYVLTGLTLGLLMIILPFSIMENFFSDLYNSFNNKKDVGFSARKLTAFTFVMYGGYIHYKFVTSSNAMEALIIDSCVALICLGIITASNVIEFKNGKKDEHTDTEDKP